jgi:hypothetical protein
MPLRGNSQKKKNIKKKKKKKKKKNRRRKKVDLSSSEKVFGLEWESNYILMYSWGSTL